MHRSFFIELSFDGNPRFENSFRAISSIETSGQASVVNEVFRQREERHHGRLVRQLLFEAWRVREPEGQRSYLMKNQIKFSFKAN